MKPQHAVVLEGCAVACEAVTDLISARAAARAARDKTYSIVGYWYAAAAAAAAADAADAAAAAAAARDGVLSLAAKIAVDALRKCKAQGVRWLKLAA